VLVAFAVWLSWRIDGLTSEGARLVGSFWASGDAANAGLDPFGTHPLTPVHDLGTVVVPENNLNPPLLLPIFQLLALFDPTAAARAWVVASAVVMVGALAMLARPGTAKLPLIWALSNWMVFETLLMGQLYALLLALAATA
jgi:hypothetical protein